MTKAHGWMFLRLIAVVAFITGLVWLIGAIFAVSYPFWISAALVAMFYPLITFLRNKLRFPNMLAVILTLLFGLSIVGGALTGIVFLIIFGVQRIARYFPDWIRSTAEDVQDFFNESIFPLWQSLSGMMETLTPQQQATLQNGIEQLGSQLAEVSTDYGQRLADGLTQVIIFVPTMLLIMLFVIIGFYFIGKDWSVMTSRVYRATPAAIVKKARAFKKMFKYRVFGFLRAQVFLMFIAAIIVLIGLLILQVENAVTIAIIVGVAEILPYLGSGTILIPWFIYMMLIGDLGLGIGLAIVYGVTVAIRQAIEPKVLSSSMNLNTLAVLISLFAGFQIFGVVGVFIGPFILVVLVISKDVGIIHELWRFVQHGFKETPKEAFKKHG
ncbi:sporulation integral membrane protein YtvI [Salisediminibacterium halotolerans]|uniref:Sporulation integral membrane protein YtvI n=1 Tax=Salisediminibacterium halotolerans TaxID=517425 RepID=A0A1H9UHP5_9BACI|nr:sporulation integral membrane protein YtvI [Salisediminibacterium haloalkalitolerans]SES08761.1 sporulation integral membrane protein YtvI [Salisediminibacterium haloalkalitolerans]